MLLPTRRDFLSSVENRQIQAEWQIAFLFLSREYLQRETV